MSRYVFLNSEAQDDKVLAAARKAARTREANVVKTTTLPERKPLESTKALGAPAAVAKLWPRA
jgi:hypothetical protein